MYFFHALGISLESLKPKQEYISIGARYLELDKFAKCIYGLDGLPFSLSALGDQDSCHIVNSFEKLSDHNFLELEVRKLINFLKKETPKKSYENPILNTSRVRITEECSLQDHIFMFGIDLPGSRYNPLGMGYFSDFFMDMFFGNFTEFMEHVNKLSSISLKKAMKRREGFCRFNPVFAPIEGMLRMNDSPNLCACETKEFKMMFCGTNENKHLEILKKLLQLGADPNAHDIYGYNPLHYLMKPPFFDVRIDMMKLLLKYGANPDTRFDLMGSCYPLDVCCRLKKVDMRKGDIIEQQLEAIELLVKHQAKTSCCGEIRRAVEEKGDVDLVVRVREILVWAENICEKSGCKVYAEKRCSACGLVFYCTPACQKLDWKFHKVSCQRNKKI